MVSCFESRLNIEAICSSVFFSFPLLLFMGEQTIIPEVHIRTSSSVASFSNHTPKGKGKMVIWFDDCCWSQAFKQHLNLNTLKLFYLRFISEHRRQRMSIASKVFKCTASFSFLVLNSILHTQQLFIKQNHILQMKKVEYICIKQKHCPYRDLVC